VHTPRLSVVIVCTGDTVSHVVDCADLDATLAALHAQVDAPDTEIVVPCHARMMRIDEVQRRFPRVRFLDTGERLLRRGSGREHHDALRARGAAMAHGDVIAFLEDHVRPHPHWSRV
jgi:hypothetical protein